MAETTVPALVAAVSGLVAAYWICLIVGGGLILISTLLGGHGQADVDAGIGGDFDLQPHADLDVGADAGVDVGADAGVDLGADAHVEGPGGVGGHHHHVEHPSAASLASWFSIQFLVYFMAIFGAVGVILTYLGDGMSSGLVVLLALAGGLVVGQGVHQLLRYVRRTSGDSTLQPGDYVNRLARVTIAVQPGRQGEVVVQVRGDERYIPAVARRPDTGFARGEAVAVVGYSAGVAEIVSRQEYEFLNDSVEGGPT